MSFHIVLSRSDFSTRSYFRASRNENRCKNTMGKTPDFYQTNSGVNTGV